MSLYSHEAEGLRVIDTGKSKFKIVLDRSTGHWSVQADSGPLPVALRNRSYTSHKYAAIDVKNYIDGHAERQITYSNKKVKD